MALIDDVRAARVRQTATGRDRAAEVATLEDELVTQLGDTLFARLRPVPATSWLTDEELRAGSHAFAVAAIAAHLAANGAR